MLRIDRDGPLIYCPIAPLLYCFIDFIRVIGTEAIEPVPIINQLSLK